MRKMIKMIKIALACMTMVALCCSCTNQRVEGNTDSADANTAEADNTINLGEVIQQMKEEQASSTPSPSASPSEENTEVNPDDIVFPEHEQVITEEDQIEPQGNELQLVFLGDSIFDNNRDGTGVPYLTAVQCNADVYNLAIGGTTATLDQTEPAENETWESRGLQGVVKAMKKQIPTTIFEGTRAKEILDNPDIDFSKTDYFIVEYGINDYFSGFPRSYDDKPYSRYTYSGALRNAISELRELAPDCTIILCPPHYCQFFNGDRFVGDSNVTDKGAGTLMDYKGTCEYIAGEQQTLFLDTYDDLGINGYTADEYLEDGIHLTEKGRQIYADALARLILSHEEEKNN